ncbi:Kinesin-like protein KIN-7I [Cardamine amara subsp. amara]|uniref:Kinesin-like protein KIN-7I n=1 Tax=Cardamine amara subsp. amara TaxID=228776 RepID=A0ABD1BZE0_CARAN
MVAGGEEKILVSVRVRPLNEKEKTRNDRCDWECINDTTIICNYHNLPDKSSYTFDRVFGFESPTKQVYDDGAKEVALCVLSGINSSIFAYGQTSSGKTYTMSGITQFAMNDIFAYIDKHQQERKFILKFSAMEIYNEGVRDLLCEDSNTPLRLLDDPERGTVVEKLREETLTDKNHLQELISICETQRKIGETSLNEISSRSHQILRLTIESSSQEFSPESSATLAASVCFVDLAGSERASQTLSAGSRLKEGCHINRSLLTLGTVIRKLSKGKNGHIPYRDSKLTRILQNSLGGNARTAIICTMSPARSHLEQSRNTLLFATCAKEVTTNAQVNLVVSEKALVKQLQRELARMENELKNLGPASSSSTSEFYALMLKQKEELIAKMEEQIQELKWQRDVAQSRVENLLKSTAEERSSSSSMDNNKRRRSYDSTDFDEPRLLTNLGKSNLYSPDEDGFLLDDTTPQFPGHDVNGNWEEIAQITTQEPEDACKEVRCVEVNSGEAENIVQIQDSLDDIVEKKEYERNYISFTPDESEKKDAESSSKSIDMELTLYDKLKGEDDQVIKKLVEEVQETEKTVEKQRQSSKKEDMDQSEQVTESPPDEEQCVLVYGDSDKLEAEDELTIKELVEDVQETEKSVEKQRQSSKKEDMDQSEEVMKSPIEEEQCVQVYEGSDKVEAQDELTINKLEESQEIEQSVEKEDKKTSWSTNKEDIEQNLSMDQSEQLSKSPPEEEKRVKEHGGSDKDDNTYEALKKKVKEMQKTIEYFMSMQSAEEKQSPSFNMVDDIMSPKDYLKMRRSRSCRENLLFTKASAAAAAASRGFILETSNTSFDSSDYTVSMDAQSMKDSDTETSSSSFHEFMAGLKERAMQNNSMHDPDHRDTETKTMRPENTNDGGEKAEFERQQSQIIELWEVCNVPLVHRTYFFLLFKGDPSDFVYMEVELRRLSFLKDSPEAMRKQTAKALTLEREWLAKQVPSKFGKKQREEVYKKWNVELSSKRRSLQVTHKLWINTKDIEHCKESASLVATLVGFVESTLTPKEMFGLSFSPTTFNIKPSSGWRFSNSFSRISFTG